MSYVIKTAYNAPTKNIPGRVGLHLPVRLKLIINDGFLPISISKENAKILMPSQD